MDWEQMMDKYYTLLRQIDELGDQELDDLFKYVRTLLQARERMAKYDLENDTAVTGEGLFEGPSDLSEKVEDILYSESTTRY
jgi:hypothetical protein